MKYLLLLVSFVLSSCVYTQKRYHIPDNAIPLPSYVKIEKGALQTNFNKKAFLSDIVLQDSSGFYGYNTSYRLFPTQNTRITLFTPFFTGLYYLSHFDTKMNLEKQVEVHFKYTNRYLGLLDIKSLQGTLYAFLWYYSEKYKKTNLFVQSINKTTLQPNDDLQKLAEIQAISNDNRGEFHIDISKDESKILIYGKMPKTKGDAKEDGEIFSLTVLDSRANLLWKKSIVLPYIDALYKEKNIKVDNDGNVFLLGTLYKDKVKEKNRDGEPNYDEIILFYTKNGEKEDEYRIDLKDKFITDLSIMPTNQGEIICTGLYAGKIRGSTPHKGIFFLRANAFSKKIEAEDYKEFDKEMLEQFIVGKGLLKRNGLYDFDMRDIILRSDGGAILLAEQFFMLESTRQTKYGGSSTIYSYYYNNILAVNISPSGAIDWLINIPKIQGSANDWGRHSSYASMITNDKIYLIYNDSPSNLTVKTGKARLSNSAIVTLVEINSDGTWNKYPLYSNLENKTITRPKVLEKVGKNQLILEADRFRKYSFTRITIDY